MVMLLGQYPYITTLPDISQYKFRLPKANIAFFPKRDKKMRDVFDIKEFIHRQSEFIESKRNIFKPNSIFGDRSHYELIEEIDRNIAQIEAEEEAEKVVNERKEDNMKEVESASNVN